MDLTGLDRGKREISFVFSSNAPVKRRGATEYLSHRPGALDTWSLDQGIVLFLKDHDFNQIAGEIVAYRLGSDKNYATARIYNTQLGDELLADIEAGRSSISVGYRIDEAQIIEDGAEDKYMIEKYSVQEISSVATGADRNTYIGREAAIASMSDDERAREVARLEVLIAWQAEQDRQKEAERLRLINEACEKIQYYLW